MLKSPLLLTAAILAFPATSLAATPSLTIAQAKLAQKKLVYKVSARVKHDDRVLGRCYRVNRLAVDCTASLFSSEVAGGETIRTVRKYKITVRRSATSKGYTTFGHIAEVSYEER